MKTSATTTRFAAIVWIANQRAIVALHYLHKKGPRRIFIIMSKKSSEKKSGASPAKAKMAKDDDTSNIVGTSGVLEYLQCAVPPATLRLLYVDEEEAKIRRGPFVCRAVLQRLSAVAQQVVVRLSCTDGEFPRSGVQIWIHQSHPHNHEEQSQTRQNNSSSNNAHARNSLPRVLQELKRWAIIEDESAAEDASTIKMTPEFYQGVKDCFRHLDVCPWQAVDVNSLPSSVKPMKTDDLERYTLRVWDSVLHFLVGSENMEEPPTAVVDFLLRTGLMQPDPEDRSRDPNLAALVITEKGYDFMLQDQHRQVWLFVEQYLQMSSKVREVLLICICLSMARVGESYPIGALPKSSRKILRHLSHFGLVYLQEIPVPTKENPNNHLTMFYPTRIATQLLGATTEDQSKMTPASALWSLSSKALEAALAFPDPKDSSHLAILVQTNFQVCAYTTSELHLRMLGLFCEVPSIRRLPNIIFLRITRDSVKGAFNLGIQARQILRFLEKHAHPRLRTRTANAAAGSGLSPVPANVVDQIWLWDRERSRVCMTEVYQHVCTLKQGEFDAVLQFAKDRDAHVWNSPAKQTIYVDYQHAERVRAYAQQYKARIHASRQSAEKGK